MAVVADAETKRLVEFQVYWHRFECAGLNKNFYMICGKAYVECPSFWEGAFQIQENPRVYVRMADSVKLQEELVKRAKDTDARYEKYQREWEEKEAAKKKRLAQAETKRKAERDKILQLPFASIFFDRGTARHGKSFLFVNQSLDFPWDRIYQIECNPGWFTKSNSQRRGKGRVRAIDIHCRAALYFDKMSDDDVNLAFSLIGGAIERIDNMPF